MRWLDAASGKEHVPYKCLGSAMPPQRTELPGLTAPPRRTTMHRRNWSVTADLWTAATVHLTASPHMCGIDAAEYT